MSLPATIDQELIDDINRFMTEPMDDFNFRLLLRKTDKLLPVNAAHAYMFKGILYSLAWDEKRMRENFSKAENLASNDVALLRNIAVSFARLSLDAESCEYYIRSHRLVRSSEELLIICVQACIATNLPNLAKEALEIYFSAGGFDSPAVQSCVNDLEIYMERLEVLKLTPAIAADMYSLVGEIIRKYKVVDQNSRVWFNNEDGVSYLVADIAVDAAPETVSRMNQDLTECVVDNFSFEDSDKLIYQFVVDDKESSEVASELMHFVQKGF